MDSLLSQGLHILAGSPKLGKSWLALWLSVTVAKGEPVWGMSTRQGTTLYLCLEDSVLRIQSRLFEITEDVPDNVHFCTECAPIGQGLEEQVNTFLPAHPDGGPRRNPPPAQPLVALLSYGCGVPLAGTRFGWGEDERRSERALPLAAERGIRSPQGRGQTSRPAIRRPQVRGAAPYPQPLNGRKER